MVNSSSRSGRKVIWVCVHTAEGIRKAADLRAFFERSTNSSAHAVADDTTLLDNLVSYSQAAWTLRYGNPASDNLELCGFASWSRDEWLTNHKGMLNNAASWIRARCLARGIPIRKVDAAGVRRGDAGVIGHVDYTNGTGDGTHWDPGPDFPWDYVIARAAGSTTKTEEEMAGHFIDHEYPASTDRQFHHRAIQTSVDSAVVMGGTWFELSAGYHDITDLNLYFNKFQAPIHMDRIAKDQPYQ
jgi:hypothetical protein